ncbi:glutamate-gated chloride channel-like [Tachypleus tridentatus]|uniref:glutamate-gated chloride channel-like n=1 Tax=Tachypleus tridentatus TaxID=6853 RepID=UPI003FD25EC5
MIGFLVTICLLLSLTGAELSEESALLRSLVDPSKYDKNVPANGEPVEVSVQAYIRAIEKIDVDGKKFKVQLTFRQYWMDKRLKFSSPRINYLSVNDHDSLWTPDIFFTNSYGGEALNLLSANSLLRIMGDGKVVYSRRINLELSCERELAKFPLDTLTCPIIPALYGSTTDKVILKWKDVNPVAFRQNMDFHGFTLKSTKQESCTAKTNTGNYGCVKLIFQFKRNFGIYFCHLYLTALLMVVLSWLSFWIHYSKVSIRSFYLAVLLFLGVVSTIYADKMIPNSPGTTASDVWNGICFLFILATIIQFVLQHTAAKDKSIELKDTENAKDGEEKNKINIKFIPLPVGRLFNRNASKADMISRIVFPILFLLFNVVYWPIVSA